MQNDLGGFAAVLANPILNTDSYKASHFLQYPPDASAMFSYVESRGRPLRPHGVLRPADAAEGISVQADHARDDRRGARFLHGAWRAIQRGRLALYRRTLRRLPAGEDPRGARGPVVPVHNDADDGRMRRPAGVLARVVSRDDAAARVVSGDGCDAKLAPAADDPPLPGKDRRRSRATAVQAARLRRTRRVERGVGRDRRCRASRQLHGFGYGARRAGREPFLSGADGRVLGAGGRAARSRRGAANTKPMRTGT